MTKDEIVEKLKAAQRSHIEWVACAEALVSGAEVDKNKIPLTYANCEFGRWYYGAGQCLSVLPTFNALEEPHKALHGFYHEIFVTLYGEEAEKSFLKKLFTNQKKHTAEKYENAKAVLPQLEQASNQMVRSLRLLEVEVFTMSDDKFAKLYCN